MANGWGYAVVTMEVVGEKGMIVSECAVARRVAIEAGG